MRWLPETDVRAFREAVATNNWRTASRLYKDDFLAVSLPADVGGFDAWVMLERESLQAAWQEACLNYALQLEEEAKFTEAAMQLKQILDKDALAEDVLQRYLKLAYLADQRDSALSQYERFRKKLETELDLEPLAETLHLVDTIRQASFAAPPAEQGSAKGQTQQVPLAILRPPKLVGRDKERQAVQVSSTGVVFIEGEAGAGKSRLMTELAPEALRIRCQEGLEQVPFYPLTSFIRATYESNDLSLLGHYLDDLTRLLPDISMGVPAPVLDSDLGRGRLLEALFRYCELVCSKDSEFRLIVDDLQWADEATLAFVNFVAAQQRLRILGAYRKYEQTKLLETSINQLKSAGNLTVITLEPLSEEAILTLLSQLMGTASGPPIFAKWLSENTGGNPMFALETLKSLFETEVLRSNEKGWHTSIDDITRDYSELKVPTAVADIIQRRVEQLSEASIRVLSAASVMQTGFTPKR